MGKKWTFSDQDWCVETNFFPFFFFFEGGRQFVDRWGWIWFLTMQWVFTPVKIRHSCIARGPRQIRSKEYHPCNFRYLDICSNKQRKHFLLFCFSFCFTKELFCISTTSLHKHSMQTSLEQSVQRISYFHDYVFYFGWWPTLKRWRLRNSTKEYWIT